MIHDHPTFEQIVDAHYAALYRFAFSMCRQEATAKDLVQQTYLKWATKGHLLRDVTKVKTWLFTTLYREYLGIARHEKKFQQVEFEPDLHGSIEEGANGSQPRVDSQTLQLALDRLDPLFRAPVILFYLKELSYREIAEALDIPIGTVMSRLSRGKTALRQLLCEFDEGTLAQSPEKN